ncbi:MAG TPA: hypothetical protein VME46_15320, partial [Acidimicrobiales bacterium]|nr:hypothetical protein [Acidimicrobiales bacterium]
ALRQAEQEVVSLREWVDTHKAHLLAVLRDAHARVESAGLLSEPPIVTYQPPDRHDAVSLQTSEPAAPGGTGNSQEAAYQGAHGSRSEDQTGQWDTNELGGVPSDNGAAQGPPPPPAEGFAASPGYGGSAGIPAHAASQGGASDSVPAPPANGTATAPAGSPPQPNGAGSLMAGAAVSAGTGTPTGSGSQGAATPAFSERALDDFFSEQDLGQPKGGFFRRRQY